MNLPLGRSVAVVLAAALLLIGAACLRESSRGDHMCEDAAGIELVSIPDAFASPGVYTASFHQKYSFTCKQLLVMKYHPPSATWEDAQIVIEGLAGEVSIADSTGRVIHTQPLHGPRPISADRDTHAVWPAFQFQPVRTGDYTLKLLVSTNSPEAAKVRHQVVLKYEVCGLEHFPITIIRCIGIASLVVGALIGGVVFLTKRRETKDPNHGIEPNSPPLALRAVAHAERSAHKITK